MSEIEVLEESILQDTEKKILELVSLWILENEELLGLNLMYFYDGEAVDLGIEIRKFQYDKDVISGGRGFSQYYSFILQGQNDINKSFDKLFTQYRQQGIYLGSGIKSMVEKIEKRITKINWCDFVTVDEGFDIEIIEND